MIPLDHERSPSLIDRLRTNLLPRVDPELRPPLSELARKIVIIELALLGLWALGLLVLNATDGPLHIAPDLAGIAFLAAIGAGCLWLLQRGSVNPVGYLLSLGLYAVLTVGAILAPDFVSLVSAGLLLPILISGVLIGGTAPYLFAGLAIASNVGLIVANPTALGSTVAQIIFLATHSVAALATAWLSGSLSAMLRRTVTSMHSQAEQMGKLAHTDPLTSLPNRRQLFEQLQQEFARAKRYRRPFCLLYMDMDGFKAINDQFGHLFGDEILRGSARSMRAVLRTTDLLARIGGDEFAVLLPETNLAGASSVATKLRKALMAYGTQLSPSLSSLTLSVGVGQINPDDEQIEDILARADKAQYLAKSAGKAITRTQDDLDPTGASEQA